MAKVTIIDETPVPPPRRVLLDLSEDEAKALTIILGNTGTDPKWAQFVNKLFTDLNNKLNLPSYYSYTYMRQENCIAIQGKDPIFGGTQSE